MIRYYNENVTFSLSGKRFNNRWLKAVAESENFSIGDMSIIYCSDSYILNMNRRFLKHDYYTDIITFDYSKGRVLSGDLFISIDSVKDNAASFGDTFDNELNRVMVHGVLHLMGYDDHTEDEQKMMRLKENEYLALKEQMLVGELK
ncbi:MAG: rRNA maturation RNase YbeY [Bacteroidales bacterium]|nr:rRNA maturation RNase YbeY [Bacteroidales bacterium]MDY6001098.1 rRNA maturation RNase YbeY [Candidatus Cryptobacteroides sp.]